MSEISSSGDDQLLEAQSTNTKLDTLNTNVSKEAKQDSANLILSDIKTNTDGLGIGDTGSGTSVGISATSVTLISANTDRKQVIIRNDTNQNMFISHGATATISSAVRLKKNDSYIEDKYTGTISGIWISASGGGNAQITEITKA